MWTRGQPKRSTEPTNLTNKRDILSWIWPFEICAYFHLYLFRWSVCLSPHRRNSKGCLPSLQCCLCHIRNNLGEILASHTFPTVTNFFSLWGITHKMSISPLPTRQSFIEQAHGSLQHLLVQQKGGAGDTPAERLQKALYIFNFLNCSIMDLSPPMTRHFSSST